VEKLLLCGVQQPVHGKDRFGLGIENVDQERMVEFKPCGINNFEVSAVLGNAVHLVAATWLSLTSLLSVTLLLPLKGRSFLRFQDH